MEKGLESHHWNIHERWGISTTKFQWQAMELESLQILFTYFEIVTKGTVPW